MALAFGFMNIWFYKFLANPVTPSLVILLGQ
jgi:hypothetical protein